MDCSCVESPQGGRLSAIDSMGAPAATDAADTGPVQPSVQDGDNSESATPHPRMMLAVDGLATIDDDAVHATQESRSPFPSLTGSLNIGVAEAGFVRKSDAPRGWLCPLAAKWTDLGRNMSVAMDAADAGRVRSSLQIVQCTSPLLERGKSASGAPAAIDRVDAGRNSEFVRNPWSACSAVIAVDKPQAPRARDTADAVRVSESTLAESPSLHSSPRAFATRSASRRKGATETESADAGCARVSIHNVGATSDAACAGGELEPTTGSSR
eukprot:scaffold198760_cov28-Tisochrysis_lutea.AAC.4